MPGLCGKENGQKEVEKNGKTEWNRAPSWTQAKIADYLREFSIFSPFSAHFLRFFLAFWTALFFLLQGIPCFFDRFSLRSQEFEGVGGEKNPCFFGGFPCLKKTRKRRSGLRQIAPEGSHESPAKMKSLSHNLSSLECLGASDWQFFLIT